MRRLLEYLGLGLLACCAVAVLANLPHLDEPRLGDQLTGTLRAVATGLFLGAGVFRIARWRFSGDAASGLTGAALLVLGGAALPLTSLARSLDRPGTMLTAYTLAATSALALALFVWALHVFGAGGQRSRAPEWTAMGVLGVSTAIIGLALASSAWELGTLPHRLILAALALGWLGVAFAAHGWSSGAESWPGRDVPLLATLGVAEALCLPSALAPSVWLLASAALTAAVAAAATYDGLAGMVGALGDEHQRASELTEALAEAHSLVSGRDRWREDLRHDTRNALAGLRAALLTMERYGDRLDRETTEKLRSAALSEIGHLEYLITRHDHEPTVDFAIDSVVEDVVAARRAAGLVVRVEPLAATAHGRPGDLATALQNLLVNAAKHAPGSPVNVRMTRTAERLELAVSDRGPGIAADAVERVFQRGVRGPDSTGSGLGLHTARSLMRDQGGDLELRRHDRGCEFVLTVPVAAEAPAPTPARVAVPPQRQPRHLAVIPTVETP